MNTITNVQIIGRVAAGTVEHKVIKEKDLAEFRIEGVGLRISAWEKNAALVPEDGLVVVNGYLSTRQYEYEGKTRESTDIRCTSIQVIETIADEEPF